MCPTLVPAVKVCVLRTRISVAIQRVKPGALDRGDLSGGCRDGFRNAQQGPGRDRGRGRRGGQGALTLTAGPSPPGRSPPGRFPPGTGPADGGCASVTPRPPRWRGKSRSPRRPDPRSSHPGGRRRRPAPDAAAAALPPSSHGSRAFRFVKPYRSRWRGRDRASRRPPGLRDRP